MAPVGGTETERERRLERERENTAGTHTDMHNIVSHAGIPRAERIDREICSAAAGAFLNALSSVYHHCANGIYVLNSGLSRCDERQKLNNVQLLPQGTNRQ